MMITYRPTPTPTRIQPTTTTTAYYYYYYYQLLGTTSSTSTSTSTTTTTTTGTTTTTTTSTRFSHTGQIHEAFKTFVKEQIRLKLEAFEGDVKRSKVRSYMNWWIKCILLYEMTVVYVYTSFVAIIYYYYQLLSLEVVNRLNANLKGR